MKKNVIRLLFALVAVLTSTSMLAENKLWIEQQSAGADGTYRFAVMMENEPAVAALQFNLVLPPEATIVTDNTVDYQYRYLQPNSERLNVSQQFYSNWISRDQETGYTTYQAAVIAMRNDGFIGTSGPLAYFTLRATDSQLVFSKPLDIKLEEIKMATYEGDKLECAPEWNGQVSVLPETTLSSSLTDVVVNPGATFSLPIELTNSYKVQALSFNVRLPEGFALGKYTLNSERVAEGSGIQIVETPEKNVYYLALYNATTSAYAIRNTGSGLIADLEIIAPQSMTGDLKIDVFNVEAACDNVAYPGTGFSVAVVDGNVAYNKAKTEVDALQAALTAALQTIATECPDVKDNFKGEDIQNAINALKSAVDAAFEDQTLTPNYDQVMAPAAGIKTSIDQLVADAKAAQAAEVKRVADNKAAYEADQAAIAELQKQLNEAVTVIDAEYAEYKDAEAIAAVQAMIDKATADSKTAFDAVAKEGVYAYQLDKNGIATAIEGLVLAAQAAKDQAAADAEAKRQADNKAAYDKDMESLDALYAHYRDIVAEIQADYKAFEDVSAELAVRNNLDAVKDAVEKAYKAVEKEGTYSYVLDVEGLTASIDQLLADAKARKEAADAETLRQAENKAAYDKVMEDVAALQAKFQETVATIKSDYPAFEDVEAENAVNAQIQAVIDAANAAYAAVEKEGKFEFTFDAAPIETAIDNLLVEAKAKEDARVEANKAAYDTVLAEIAKVQEEFDAALAEITEKYPQYNATNEALAITKALTDAQKEADAAFAAVEKEGVFSYEFNADAVREMIATMVANAIASGVDAIIAEAEAGNVRIFTLDGTEHARPVVGKVNLIVRKDGTVSKVMVK